MMPKAGVFKQSEVFQVLNDEQLKSKAEKEQDEKYQWTTFLQKPSRPPPLRSTQQVPTNSYKPLIVKQPKPKCAPDYREATPVGFKGIHHETLLLKYFSFRNHHKFKLKSPRVLLNKLKRLLNRVKFKSRLNVKALLLKFHLKPSSLLP